MYLVILLYNVEVYLSCATWKGQGFTVYLLTSYNEKEFQKKCLSKHVEEYGLSCILTGIYFCVNHWGFILLHSSTEVEVDFGGCRQNLNFMV